jgi:hypothetical protein
MDLDALASVLAITNLCMFAASRDAIDWHPDRAEIGDVIALDDGSALVTQWGDAGSFLSRMRPDGTRAWITGLPGSIEPHSLASNRGMIAIEYTEDGECGIAVVAVDGSTRWHHGLGKRCDVELGYYTVFAGDTVVVWPTFGEVIGLSLDDGNLLWDHTTTVQGTPKPAGDGTVAIHDRDRTFFLDPKTGDIRERRGCQLGRDHLVLHEQPGNDLLLGESGFAASIGFGNEAPAELIGCATYAGQIVVLVDWAQTTWLKRFDRDGHLIANRELPHVDVTPAFDGELPRRIPLVERHDTLWAAMLVDVETGQVVARTPLQEQSLHAIRDGATAYFIEDFNPSLLELLPGDHAFRVRATSDVGMFDSRLVGGGVVWTFRKGDGSLSAPALTARRVQVI